MLGPLLQGKEAAERPGQAQLGNPSRPTRRLLQLWDQLVVSKGVLCRFETPDGGSSPLQVVVPTSLQKEVLTELHEGALGGHLGVDKTLGRLKE